MSVKRVKFSPEFKQQMVELFLEEQSRKTLAQVARENGIGAETLRVWVKKYRVENPDAEPPLTVSERARLAELERENRELRLEREFLGKVSVCAVALARSGLKMGVWSPADVVRLWSCEAVEK